MAVYMIEADKRIGNPDTPHGTAQLYLGYCEDGRVLERLEEHRKGRGASITRAMVEQGCTLTLVLYLPTLTRTDERRLKNRKNHRAILRKYRSQAFMTLLEYGDA